MAIIKATMLLAALIPSVWGTTIFLAGDSTMAKGGGGSGTDVTVSNQAIGGRSARSYTREGRFKTIANQVQAGDWVIIEFGHNDGGSLSQSDNGRTDCGGTGDETCTSNYNGVTETILTFPKYLENAAKTFKSKGANVIISSQTPNNVWEGGSYVYAPSRFVGYAKLAAETAGVHYIDHGAYVADIYRTKGNSAVNAYYPNDHTHTSPAGASVVAQAFFKAVVCGRPGLEKLLKRQSFEGRCL
ncbi:Rhamnogalacturonan acetylesterase [Penicillium diatomitis]|uniref:Rhamnogalacturonan acetylesterase n=1 Tax=Penicillium diatomitis TaxID=2819901 RepID=A0A9W9WUT7_9EURO|nr:Rhamnogalacturonan acetylesterase [Penicillium diatomitis]KAJ5475703.1 Rhamnogalacturonan acetylesterase [Penicillium diatomitis]